MKRWVAAVPAILPLLILTAACLLIREQYPFSDFPMYSRFGRSTYYVYLAQGDGRPLPSYHTIGVSTATLKKVFDSELGQQAKRLGTRRGRLSLDDRRAVAERVLTEFRRAEADGRIGDLPEVFQLYEVRVRLAAAGLQKETQLLAEVR